MAELGGDRRKDGAAPDVVIKDAVQTLHLSRDWPPWVDKLANELRLLVAVADNEPDLDDAVTHGRR